MSSVTCSTCHSKSSTIDPILDIQLDFPYHLLSGAGSTDAGPAGTAPEPLTLAGLLRQFTAAEKLGKMYDCAKCGPGQNAKRRLRVKRLPQVLSFQLKVCFVFFSQCKIVDCRRRVDVVLTGQRFAHGATSTKVELPVRFPSQLNMRPYVAEDEHEDARRASGASDAPQGQGNGHVNVNDLPDALYQYDLFCVVTHEGKLDNGHYWADVLSEGEWWHCDDDKG